MKSMTENIREVEVKKRQLEEQVNIALCSNFENI